MIEGKELRVGGKVIVMRTEGEFDAFEAYIVHVAVTKKSARVMRAGHADAAMKEHGAGWLAVVAADDENTEVTRATLEEMFKPVEKAAEFMAEFRMLAQGRNEQTKKMEDCANRFGFHQTKVEHEDKIKASKGKKGKKPAEVKS